MTSPNTRPRQMPERFWTARRVSLTCIVLTLLLAIGVAGCATPENVTTTKGSIPDKNAPATNAAPVKGQPPTTNAAPPATAGALPSVPLPASLFEMPLPTIDGKSLKLADYKGKVVVINLWASWCGPCRVETPELMKMSKEYKERGVEFIGLTTKPNDPEVAPVEEFVREQRVAYPIVWEDGRFAATLTEAVRARAVIPQSFVITREGGIYKHFEGFSAAQTPQMLRQAIEQALAAKS